jgi:uncharacterized protein (UPF0332 family)
VSDSPEQKEKVQKAFDRSQVTLREMEILFQAGFHHGAADRAYYAAFHAVTAALLSKGLEFARHAAVISHFGKEFIKTGVFDLKHHQTLIEAFNLRQKADYNYTIVVDRETSGRVIAGCRELVEAVQVYLQQKTILE